MITQTYSDIVTDELIKGAIFNYEFHGFVSDYAVLHCLLRKYNPKSVMEIGTNYGTGTKIICNAVPEAEVYSVDLPYEEMHPSLKPNGVDMVGSNCNLKFHQLRMDSTKMAYYVFPCEAYFVDGEHTYENVLVETAKILNQNPKIVIYHDADIYEVYNAIEDSKNDLYELYRVSSTRIAYLLRK